MRSVLDDLRREDEAAYAAMSPGELMALSEQLGNETLEELMEARGIDLEAALRVVRQSRRAGRRPSRCLDEGR